MDGEMDKIFRIGCLLCLLLPLCFGGCGGGSRGTGALNGDSNVQIKLLMKKKNGSKVEAAKCPLDPSTEERACKAHLKILKGCIKIMGEEKLITNSEKSCKESSLLCEAIKTKIKNNASIPVKGECQEMINHCPALFGETGH